MVNNGEYMVQALKILLKTGDKNIKLQDFESLYAAAAGEVIQENPKALIERMVKFLFNDGNVPWAFFNTPIGEIIGKVKFSDDTLLLPEIADYLNYSLPYVTKLVPDEIKAKKVSRHWLVKESDFNDWLLSKGKPSLWELKKMKGGNRVKYEIEEEKIINPGFESEEEYK